MFYKSGNPARMFGTYQDITERQRAEEALQESEEFNRQVIADHADGYAHIIAPAMNAEMMRLRRTVACLIDV